VWLVVSPLTAQTTRTPARRAPKPTAPARAPAATPAPPAPQEKPVPFKPGETLVYDVSWSGYVTAGEVTVSVREKKPSYNSTAYYIVAEGKPTGIAASLYTLYFKVDSLLDVFTLLSQRGSVYSLEGKRTRMKSTVFNQRANTAEYEMRTSTVMKKTLALAPATQDGLGALYALRAMPLRAGAKVSIPVADNANKYVVTLFVEGRETIETGIGSMAAWRVRPTVVDERGQVVGRAMTIWISDDARHLPLRMKAELAVGSFDLTIKGARG
jgi:hypothetical protein